MEGIWRSRIKCRGQLTTDICRRHIFQIHSNNWRNAKAKVHWLIRRPLYSQTVPGMLEICLWKESLEKQITENWCVWGVIDHLLLRDQIVLPRFISFLMLPMLRPFVSGTYTHTKKMKNARKPAKIRKAYWCRDCCKNSLEPIAAALMP